MNTHFQRLQSQFDHAAGSYDLLTTMNPGYQRDLDRSAQGMKLGPAPRILDLCCGTGKSTRALERAYPGSTLVALDASEAMLQEAAAKPWRVPVRFVQGDASDPASAGVEGPFHGIFMAYGLRNLVERDACLQRLYSLLAPGGVLCIHDYSLAPKLGARLRWNAVCYGIIIPSGALVSGSSEIYRYLHRSVLDFDRIDRLRQRVERAGYREVRVEGTSGWQRGIVHSLYAIKGERGNG